MPLSAAESRDLSLALLYARQMARATFRRATAVGTYGIRAREGLSLNGLKTGALSAPFTKVQVLTGRPPRSAIRGEPTSPLTYCIER